MNEKKKNEGKTRKEKRKEKKEKERKMKQVKTGNGMREKMGELGVNGRKKKGKRKKK